MTGARRQPVGVPQSEAAHVGSNQTGTDAQAVGGSERVHGAVSGWLLKHLILWLPAFLNREVLFFAL